MTTLTPKTTPIIVVQISFLQNHPNLMSGSNWLGKLCAHCYSGMQIRRVHYFRSLSNQWEFFSSFLSRLSQISKSLWSTDVDDSARPNLWWIQCTKLVFFIFFTYKGVIYLPLFGDAGDRLITQFSLRPVRGCESTNNRGSDRKTEKCQNSISKQTMNIVTLFILNKK